jgi:hypothetical protein
VDVTRLAHKFWLAWTAAAVVVALVTLAHYVNTYDDYDISPRLDAAGDQIRRAMNVVSFPLGRIVGAALDEPLERSFSCDGVATHPCAVFVHWWTHIAAIVAQSLLLFWGARRMTRNSRGD